MKNYLFTLILFLAFNAPAQAPVSETIHVNSVEAKVWSNGALFGYNNERSFKIAKSEEDTTRFTVFRRVAPWIGGYNPFGSLKIAAGAPTGTHTDFAPGFPNTDGYNHIWKVTKAEIQAHRADFADNGTIDNPLPAIMQWPGTLMLPEYAIHTEPLVYTNVAPYQDENDNDIYDPLAGDFPLPQFRNGQVPGIPDEIVFFTFHDGIPHEVTHGAPLNMQISCTLWAFSCPEEPAFDNSIFTTMEYWNRGTDPMDSLHIGLLSNFEIGKGNDDFIGCRPDKEIFYAYNGDSLDQGGFEENAPILGLFRFGNNEGFEFGEPFFDTPSNYFMRVGNTGEPVPAIAYPLTPQAFYNYMTGRWADGTPLQTGGNGYHPGVVGAPVQHIYPDAPVDPQGWSEPTSGSTPGLRRALLSFRYPPMDPLERQRANFCFTWARHPDTTNALTWALMQFELRQFIIHELTDFQSTAPIVTPSCLGWPEPSGTTYIQLAALQIWPNPGTGTFYISVSTENLTDIILTDLSGKIRYQQSNLHQSELTLDLHLPSGMYFLTALTDSNQRLTQKLIIQP